MQFILNSFLKVEEPQKLDTEKWDYFELHWILSDPHAWENPNVAYDAYDPWADH